MCLMSLQHQDITVVRSTSITQAEPAGPAYLLMSVMRLHYIIHLLLQRSASPLKLSHLWTGSHQVTHVLLHNGCCGP